MCWENEVRERYRLLAPILDERTRRLWAASEAISAGYGGVSRVSRVTGICRKTICKGVRELEALPGKAENALLPGRLRRVGGGRKSLLTSDPTLAADLESLVAPTTRGDPESPLRWTLKSVRQLAEGLKGLGHRIGRQTVSETLHSLGYSLQANRKTKEGGTHPDRDAQFGYINQMVQTLQSQGQPVISVDAKKKELVGEYKNQGREWRLKGEPEDVNVHDFMDKTLGKATPYGVYDMSRNEGWVSVGIDHDTASFAVESIRRWWQTMGRPLYGEAKKLLVTADGGGSNGSRVRLWKVELQRLADETGLEITVCHLPPGTSKWNKIEHKLFSFISTNWRGRPLISHAVIVQLIAATTTRTGLSVQCRLDTNAYPKGIIVTNDQMAALNIHRHDFHPEWNYTITPNLT